MVGQDHKSNGTKSGPKASTRVLVYHPQDECLESLHDPPPNRRWLMGAVWNYSNLVVGNALVALPYTMAQAGMVGGLALFILLSSLSAFTSYHLASTGLRSRNLSYDDLATFCFGRAGHVVSIAAILLNDFGSMVTRVVVIGDMVGPVHRLWVPALSRAVTVLVVCTALALPLALLRDFQSLSASSLASFVANMAIVLLLAFQITTRSYADISDEVHDTLLPGDHPFRAFGTINFLFATQEFSFQVFRSTGTTDKAQWRLVATCAMVLSVSVCVLVSVSGVLAFGDTDNSDVLDNFPDNDTVANVMRVVCCLIVLTGFPLDLFISRFMLCRLLGLRHERTSLPVHVALTALLFFAALGVGACMDDLGLVQSVVGSVSGVLVGSILPAACVLKTNLILDHRLLVGWRDVVLGLSLVCGVLACSKALLECASGDDNG